MPKSAIYQFEAQTCPLFTAREEPCGLPYQYQTKLSHYIDFVVAEFPRIRMSGVYVTKTARNEEYGHGDYPTWSDESKAHRDEYSCHETGYLLAVGFCRQFIVEKCIKTKTVGKYPSTTYYWKHEVEDWLRSGPNAAKRSGYIHNGAFLAACILEGVKFKVSEGSPNAVPFLKLKDEK